MFPLGVQAGTSAPVVFTGSGLKGLRAVSSNHSGITFRHLQNGTFQATATAETPPGLYDAQTLGEQGLNSPFFFLVSTRPNIVEADADSSSQSGRELVKVN